MPGSRVIQLSSGNYYFIFTRKCVRGKSLFRSLKREKKTLRDQIYSAVSVTEKIWKFSRVAPKHHAHGPTMMIPQMPHTDLSQNPNCFRDFKWNSTAEIKRKMTFSLKHNISFHGPKLKTVCIFFAKKFTAAAERETKNSNRNSIQTLFIQ